MSFLAIKFNIYRLLIFEVIINHHKEHNAVISTIILF